MRAGGAGWWAVADVCPPSPAQYLSAPVTEKENLSGSRQGVEYGISAHQGWRKTMEDAHIAHHFESLADGHLFAVFDGHGGHEVAQFCSMHMPGELEGSEEFKAGDFRAGLEQASARARQGPRAGRPGPAGAWCYTWRHCYEERGTSGAGGTDPLRANVSSAPPPAPAPNTARCSTGWTS